MVEEGYLPSVDLTFAQIQEQRRKRSHGMHGTDWADFSHSPRPCCRLPGKHRQALHGESGAAGPREAGPSVAVSLTAPCNLVAARGRIRFGEMHFKRHLPTLGG